MKHVNLKILFVPILILIVTACSSRTAPTAIPATVSSNPIAPTASVSPTPASTATPVAPASLGSFKFTPDTSKKQTIQFTADGKDASVSATDAAGFKWTLTIPKDALLNPQTISLSPFANVDSSQAALPMTSGVLMEPDGLQFANAVTLTVTPPASTTRKGLMVLAAQDGSNIEFAETTRNGQTYSAPIWHFSGGGFSDPPDDKIQPLIEQALAEYHQAQTDLKALERVVDPIPVPPDYEPSCDDKSNEAAQKQVDAYVDQFFARERPVIQRLLGTARTLALLGADPGDSALALVRELIETRVFRRVNTLFSDYGNDPKKLFAVAQVALAVDRQYELLGGTEQTAWLEKIGEWATRARDYERAKLRNDHDYSVFPKVLLSIERTVVLLGGRDDSAQFLDEMAKAMTFKLTFDDKITVQRPAAPHAETRSEFIVKPDTLFSKITGSGDGNYLSAAYGTNDIVQLQSPKSFTANGTLTNWDSCEKMTVDITLDRFGADTETYVITSGSAPPVVTQGIPNGATGRAFPGGKFTATLKNKQAEAVNQTFTAQAGDANQTTVTVQMILLHTPQ